MTGRATWSETWRVLAYTLAVALAFIALGRLQLALFNLPIAQTRLNRAGLVHRDADEALRQEATRIAEASRGMLAGLPPGHRLATLHLGYALGYASDLLGSHAMSPAAARAVARRRADALVAQANERATELGLGDVAALDAASLKEFTELRSRYEADENGLAERIEERLSPMHRHFYLLGVHLGGESARIEESEGQFSLPPESQIRRHATLAGIGAEWWQPLAAAPKGEAPSEIVQRYRGGLEALAREVARQDQAGEDVSARR